MDLEKETVKQALQFAKKYRKKVYAAVSNMSIAMERRDFLQQIDCFVCNQQEAGLRFSDNYEELDADEMCRTLAGNVHSANIPCMVVTMGDKGAVYARSGGECGTVPAKNVDVIDTTGAGDIFGGSAVSRFLELNKAPEALMRGDLAYMARYAAAAASLSTEVSGGIPSIPKKEAVLQKIQEEY